MDDEHQPMMQDRNTREACPKNPWGHSWKRIGELEDWTQQQCRFCRHIRRIQLSPAEPSGKKRIVSTA